MFGLLRRTHKIPCYVLVYDQVEIIEQCLDFLADSSDHLDIIVIENPSPNTPKIRIPARIGSVMPRADPAIT